MIRGGLLVVPWLLLPTALAFAVEAEIQVIEGPDGKPAAFEAKGLPASLLADLTDEVAARVFRVYVRNEGTSQVPPIAGAYRVDGDVLRFTPRYALRPGLTYDVNLFPPPRSKLESPALVSRKITIPAPPPAEPTRVVAVYPSATVLPDNQLRFYIHFSGPMSRGEAYERLKLLDAEGKPIERAFLEIGEELWDNSCQRLTVLFDPGRVKRGLKPREEFGPVLEAGKTYTLAIDKAWRDESGRPLSASSQKAITAGPPIEAALDPAAWKIAPPAAGTREALVVRFTHPLDHALLGWTIDVEGPGGKPVAGKITVADEERRWEFRPDQPWRAGKHALVVDTVLEDTAGNRIGRPFEVDVFERVDKQSGPEYVRLPFEVASP